MLFRSRARGLRPPLQAELVWPVAEHDTLEATDRRLGHLALDSIASDARTRVVDSVRHFKFINGLEYFLLSNCSFFSSSILGFADIQSSKYLNF